MNKDRDGHNIIMKDAFYEKHNNLEYRKKLQVKISINIFRNKRINV